MCRHCYIMSMDRRSDPPETAFIPPAVFEAAVIEAKPLGLQSVKWTGGEPTIHPRFGELLGIQKNLGIHGDLETNGMEIDDDLARHLARSDMRNISVSLDGAVPETHDRIRGGRGFFERTIRGIRSLVNAGFQPQLILTLMRANVGEMSAFFDLARTLGAGSVKLNILQPVLEGEKIFAQGDALSIPEIIGIGDLLRESRWKEYPFPIHLDIPMAFRPLGNLFGVEGRAYCHIKNILGVLSDGSFVLCGVGQNVPELIFGRVGETPLAQAWAGDPILMRIRRGLPKDLGDICSRCLMAEICLGSCVAQNFDSKKDMFSGFWFCEQADKAGLFPESRTKEPEFVQND
jgi:SynChlorMet cassette radical SAM/SPASM protein ScmF